jgi:sulfate transport system permease protein
MKRRNIPGFKTTMGATVVWLGLLVLLPLSRILTMPTDMTGTDFWKTVWSAQAVAAYQLTFGAALIAALANGAIGLLLAWVLVRHTFPGKNFVNSLIDIPFALPTAVAGLTYGSLYSPEGWIGRWLAPLGIKAVHNPLAVCIVLTFVSLPFVVRALQPVLEDLGTESEEAAHSLGASRWQTFRHVLFPSVLPALLTGIALAFARAVGEYGSVVFVSGNIPMKTQIAPVVVMGHIEAFEYDRAAAVALVLLVASFAINGGINFLSRWSRRHEQ